jgi:Rne/Rng family ribonuclease
VSRTLVVDPGPFTWRLGVVDDEGLAALRVVDLVAGVEGDVFRARVTAHARDLGGVFADVGRGPPVFVRLPAASRRRPPEQGAPLLVQGVADAVGDKGARATTRVTLTGAHLALRAEAGGPTVHETVPPAVAERLRTRARTLFPDRPVEVAATAATVDDAALEAEADALATLLDTVRRRFDERTAPAPLLTADERLGWAIRTLSRDVDAVVTAAPARLRVARLLASLGLEQALAPAAEPWAEAGAPDALVEVEAREMPFGEGAALVIEPTAACVAVDVDRRRATAAAADVNEAAVAALARAIVGRELAGQLVVDFLDPGGGPGRDRLEAALRARLAELDVRVVTVLRSGLVVLERPRRAAALHERRDPPRDAAERLLREATAHAIFEAAVAGDVDDRLRRPDLAEAARAWLAAHGSRLVHRRDPSLPPATYKPGNAVS